MSDFKARHAGQFEELDRYIASVGAQSGMLIAVLHRAQDLFGYLPQEVQSHVAWALAVPASRVWGVVTFYSFFNVRPKGRHRISVCLGTACFVRGSEKVLDEFKNELGIAVGQVTADGSFSLDSIRCVGACGLAPVVTVNGKVYARVKTTDIKKIIDDCIAEASGADEVGQEAAVNG